MPVDDPDRVEKLHIELTIDQYDDCITNALTFKDREFLTINCKTCFGDPPAGSYEYIRFDLYLEAIHALLDAAWILKWKTSDAEKYANVFEAVAKATKRDAALKKELKKDE